MTPKWHRVLICGDRWWDDAPAIKRLLVLLKKKHGRRLIVIAGGAGGADTIAEIEAKNHDIHVAKVDALWATRHNGAGPQRNTAMLALQPHEVYYCHRELSKSKGTKDLVKQARKAGLPVTEVKSRRKS